MSQAVPIPLSSQKCLGQLQSLLARAGWTLDRLRAEGFSEHIITALDAVTKRDGEDYDDFARRAAANPIGRNVKLADLADNCDLSRIAEPTEVDHQRIEKYQRAIRPVRAM